MGRKTIVGFAQLIVGLGVLLFAPASTLSYCRRGSVFTSATIEVAAEQRVVSTGPYAIVRHPMYVGAIVMLFGTPLALGSWWGLIAVALMTIIIVWRLIDEEGVLSRSLSGYTEYCRRVRYRLIPFLW